MKFYSKLFSRTPFSTVLNNSDLEISLGITFHHTLFDFRYAIYSSVLITVTLNFFTLATDITLGNHTGFSVYEYLLQVFYPHIREVLQFLTDL